MQDLAKLLQEIRLELIRLSATVDLLEQRYCIAQSEPQSQNSFVNLSAIELINLKFVAKNKKFGEIATCPACGVQFKKTNCGQVFCIKEHKSVFDSMLRKAKIGA